jgi:two-component system phosphate regulon sensor histidine kinase PhoR
MLLCVALAAILYCCILMGWMLVRSSSIHEQQELADSLALVAQGMPEASERSGYIAALGTDSLRVTWVAASGEVLYDSEAADVSALDNHAGRPEVMQAVAEGTGEAQRTSATLHEVTYYRAMLLDDGTVLRFSRSQASVFAGLAEIIPIALFAVVVIVFIAAVTSRLLVRRVVLPVNTLNLDSPLENDVYAEFAPLLTNIEQQRRQLARQMEAAANARQEFTANVSHELKTPLTVIAGYAELLRDGKVAPEDAGRFSALIFDEAEHMRVLVNDILILSQLDEGRSIGLPDAADDRASGALLSQADEGGFAEGETVAGDLADLDLLDLAEQAVKRLTPFAEQADVTFSLEHYGDTALRGSRKILGSIVYNLCENAVRYNYPGGKVTVEVTGETSCVRLRVTDTGIGIAPEDQAHVFERFFRVDKTRSRETGGTGLGLAIVKNGAQYHNASLKLSSAPGEGTAVTIDFPRQQS